MQPIITSAPCAFPPAQVLGLSGGCRCGFLQGAAAAGETGQAADLQRGALVLTQYYCVKMLGFVGISNCIQNRHSMKQYG
eukprot:658388-Pelagomonas_calceolata.AAC.1